MNGTTERAEERERRVGKERWERTEGGREGS